MHRLKKKQEQVFVSTHSQTLLSDRGIGVQEIFDVDTRYSEEISVHIATEY